MLSGIRRTSDIVLGMVGSKGTSLANFATALSCCSGSLVHSDDRSSWLLT